MDFTMEGQLVSSEIVLPFPTLRETCVKKIIRDTEKIVEGIEFNRLASPKYSFILGPFSNLDPFGIAQIWEYLLKNNKMSKPWLSLLIVPHLRKCLLPSSLSNALKWIQTRCHQLSELSLYQSKGQAFSIAMICQVIQQNPGLMQVKLNGLFEGNRSIDDIIPMLAYHCPELKVLDIANNTLTNPNLLLDLCGSKDAIGCQGLEEINFEFINLTGAEAVVVTMLKRFKNLQVLNLCGTFLSISEIWEILYLERVKIDLREIDMSCLDVSGNVFSHIGQLHPNIQKLNCLDTSFFEGMEDFKFTKINELAIAIPNDSQSIKRLSHLITDIGRNLRKLQLGNYCGYPTVSWKVIITNCPNLHHLDLSYCKIEIPDHDKTNDNLIMLKDYCQELSVLILNRSELRQNNRKALPGHYGLIMGPCQNLKQFSANSTLLTDVDLYSIFSAPVYKIQILELCNTDVSQDSVITVWMLAPCLEVINISGCKRINITGYNHLKALASKPQRVHATILWE